MKGCPANGMYLTCQPVCFTKQWKMLVSLGNYFQFLIHDTVHVYGVIQSLSHVRLCDPIDCSTPGSSVFLSWSLLTFMSIESGNHPTISSSASPCFLCLQSFLASGSFPELALCIMWPKYWSISNSPCNEYSGSTAFRIDWSDLLAVRGTLKSLLQYNSKASLLQCSAFLMVQLSHIM